MNNYIQKKETEVKKENMSDLLETLKKLRDQTLSIRLYSEEIYEHFSKKIESLEQALS